MRTFVNVALSICAAAALLTGCGGSQPSIGGADTMAQGRVVSKTYSNALLYVSNSCDRVCIFSYPGGSQVAQLSSGGGICPEPNGNVYQPTWSSSGYAGVEEYAHGGTQPLRSITLDKNEPFSCAVDPKSNSLAVVMVFDQIAVIPNGSGSPLYYNVDFNPKYATYDGAGNLFVDGTKKANTAVLAELSSGSNSFTELKFKKKFREISQLQWDGTYLAIEDAQKPIVYRVSVQNSTAKAVGSVKFNGVGNRAGYLWIQGTTIILPYGLKSRNPSTVALFSYPQGGKGTVILSKLRTLYGVAISVAPSP